jgi:hypothetical protein
MYGDIVFVASRRDPALKDQIGEFERSDTAYQRMLFAPDNQQVSVDESGYAFARPRRYIDGV